MTGHDDGTAGAEQAAALAPVREYLLRGARAEADRILGQARGQADQTLRQARRDAEQAVRQAREEGEAQAAPAAAAERAHGREQARSVALGAQRQACEELRAQVLAAVGRLRGEPGYERLMAGLSALAAGTAGPGATVIEHRAGGVLARSGRAVVDCSLPRLASLAVDALGDEVRELWTP
jgi:vacuolar-type H+-ATPase subunit E/Vma4